MVQHISNIVDHLDSVLAKLYDRATDDVVVLVGSDNPVDERCSIVVTRIDDDMIALLTPCAWTTTVSCHCCATLAA